MTKKIYAYFFNNCEHGIVNTWDECKKIVQNSKARYKSFTDLSEAQVWIANGGIYEVKKSAILKNIENLEEGVYFDAGTGRGRGVEVRITDKNKQSLLPTIETQNFIKYLKKNSWFINEFGNIELGSSKTNNFGELLGLYLALECAKKLNLKKVFGDSQLVITYWSRGFFQAEKLPKETISLIQKVCENRKKSELNGVSIEHISGNINPADLGFHK